MKAIRFADDKAMITSTEEGLERIIDRVIKINMKKTKVYKNWLTARYSSQN